MATPASNFILNIVELQNTIANASGLTPFASLSNTVAQLQEMVIYDEKRIAVNTISQYNTSPIQVLDSLNLAAGATITQDGATLGGGGATATSTIGLGSNVIQFTSSVAAGAPAISFQVAGGQVPLVATADGGLRLPAAGVPALGKYLVCTDSLGTAEWQVPAIPSDARLKENVRRLEGAAHILSNIQGVRFNWKGGGEEDVGVLAQEVAAVLPEAVVSGSEYMQVYYTKLIPVLIEEIKELRARVEALEGGRGGRPL
jgi:hypothetical protein